MKPRGTKGQKVKAHDQKPQLQLRSPNYQQGALPCCCKVLVRVTYSVAQDHSHAGSLQNTDEVRICLSRYGTAELEHPLIFLPTAPEDCILAKTNQQPILPGNEETGQK